MLNVARDWTDTLGDDPLNPPWAVRLRLPEGDGPWWRRLRQAWRTWLDGWPL